MKKFVFLITILFAMLVMNVHPVQAAYERDRIEQNVLCIPGVYNNITTDCDPSGPSKYLGEMAEKGVAFPITPPPGIKPDNEYRLLNYQYGYVRTNNAPVYGSIEDANKAKKKFSVRRIDSSFSYISYADESIVDGKRFYMVSPGNWMTANDVSRVSAPTFQGIELNRTPERAFGWVLTYLSPTSTVETKKTPGMDIDDFTGNFLKNHDMVWIYSVARVGDEDWYMVAPDEWVHQNLIARVMPNQTPQSDIDSDRWIEVNLFEQTVAVYEQNEMVFATLIASGIEPFWTRPGSFQIYQKLESTNMQGSFEADRSDAYYLEDVPWTMYYDKARALHGAYWRANLGFPQSHGCVNLSVGDSRWIFDWAEEGDWVYVWDPSDKTPTDPDEFGDGGA